MIKQGLAVVALLAIAGCSAQNTPSTASAGGGTQSAMTASQGPTGAELAAYAGSHQYPQKETAKNDLRTAAIVNSDNGSIKIYNFGTIPISDADVWVNRAYVRHISAIAPGSSISLHTSNLYNAVGQQFSAAGQHVDLVQVELDHTLQTLMGPAAQ